MNYLESNTGTTYSGILSNVEEQRSVRAIETQTLGGSYTVQTIGQPAKKLSVKVYCARSVRRALETIQGQNGYIKIYWRDRLWTGLITADRFDIKRWSKKKINIEEEVNFSVLVVEEAVR